MNLAFGSLRTTLKSRFDAWLAARVPPKKTTTLNRRIIYILPTGNGLMFVLASALVFIAAINYAVSLAFGLAFLMISIFILAILYSFNNLNRLQLTGLAASPVFCGEQAGYQLLLTRSKNRHHEALEFNFPNCHSSHADLFDNDQLTITVFTDTHSRGLVRAPLLKITTFFPLGLCRAWSVVDLDMHCLVYPKPMPFTMTQFSGGSSGNDDTAISVSGSEDFYGLRSYVPGDSLKQVAWKNVARGQGMQLKQFVDYVDSQVWLDWDMFYGFSVEDRLGRLCYCVLQLSKKGSPFGLKMPGVEIKPAIGVEHRNKMLKALALHQLEY
ncbi:MAG: hypothetical protein ACI95C_001613 [Pseudohongiellaceae bacterium]|jgi:uncharacterized protein (DUF58 family)